LDGPTLGARRVKKRKGARTVGVNNSECTVHGNRQLKKSGGKGSPSSSIQIAGRGGNSGKGNVLIGKGGGRAGGRDTKGGGPGIGKLGRKGKVLTILGGK